MTTGRNPVPAPAPSRRTAQRPLTLEATYTVLPNPPLHDPNDPFRVYSSTPAEPSTQRRYSPPPRKRSLMEAAGAFFDRWEAELIVLAIAAVTLLVAVWVSLFLPWVLPVTIMTAVVAIVAAAREKQKWVPCVWAASVATLFVVVFGLHRTSILLLRIDELLCNWTTYRAIAAVVLFFLVVVPLIAFLDKISPAKKPDAATAPLDPRGYGRYAIDDFVEKGTYGDASLASKGDLHLALSRRGNENLRFAPKFYE